MLLLWTTDPLLEKALQIIRAWGFAYKTVGFYWATRGKPKRKSAGVRKLIVSPRRDHSRKPDEAYERIEALVDGPYLEMFARHRRPGWDAWGDEVLADPRS